ncbi:transcriptional regulator [Kitasatospora sp. NPDC059462]|uniref:transcriptional regulator n=1 Tax=unclassified Kitasatospora TaxID=2633591 RepID=UPI0036A5B92E
MAARVKAAVNTGTGEVLQLQLLEKDKNTTYDWSGGGRHINVGKVLGKSVWRADSGYDQNDRDVFGYYLFNSPEGEAPLRESFREIGTNLGIRPAQVSKSVGRLNVGGILIEAEKIGRVTFYKLNARAAYDGSAVAQRLATASVRHPVVPCPAPKKPARKKKETS